MSGRVGFCIDVKMSRAQCAPPCEPERDEASPPPTPEETWLTLRCMNASMSLFHFSLMCLTFFVGDVSLSVPLWENGVGLNTNGSGTGFLAPSLSRSDLSFPLTVSTALFFFLSAFFHFGNAALWYDAYTRLLRRKVSPFRWGEYFLSATTMILLISVVSGVLDVSRLVLIASLIATTMTFGLVTELVSIPSPCEDEWTSPLSLRLVPHLLGYIPQITAWVEIMRTFYSSSGEGGGPPAFVYAIVWIELLLFFSFGFIQLYVLLRPPSHYERGEYMYQVASLVSKGTLGVILLTNVLFLSTYECVVDEFADLNPDKC